MAVGGAVGGLGWWAVRSRTGGRTGTVTGALRRRAPDLPVPEASADAVLQVVAVGCGASLGREGAPRQVGAAVAGWAARVLRLAPRDRLLLFACGAGAGLAAVYDVPVAGALFTLEALAWTELGWRGRELLRTVLPAAATAAVATLVARPVLGDHPVYDVDRASLTATLAVWAVAVGPVVGVAALAFVRLTEQASARIPHGARLPLATTAVFAAVGAVAMAYPEVLGNGRGPAQLAFAGAVTVPAVIVLAVLKPLATAACLGAGAAGGRLTPALATGALLGAAIGRLWSRVWPGAPAGAFAVVAAAAFLAVSLHAPLTAVALVLEFTANGTSLLVPILLAGAGAVGVRLADDRRRARAAQRAGAVRT
jgi:H+/Cl- antiporter ClcA